MEPDDEGNGDQKGTQVCCGLGGLNAAAAEDQGQQHHQGQEEDALAAAGKECGLFISLCFTERC